jgi:PAS domain S-box-containing protein
MSLLRNDGDMAMSASKELPHEQKLHHQRLLEALPVAIYATDAAGKVTYFNQAAAAFVGERADLNGNDWWLSWRLFHLDGTALPRAEFPTAVTLRERRPVRKQIIADRSNGTRITFTVCSAPVFDGSGQINGTVNGLVATEHERADYQLAELSPEGRAQIVTDAADRLQTSSDRFGCWWRASSTTRFSCSILRGMSPTGTQEQKESKAICVVRSSGSAFLASIRKKTGSPGSLRKHSPPPEAKGVSNRRTGGSARTARVFGRASSSMPSMMSEAKSLGLPR